MGVAEISLKFWENQRKRAKQNRRNVMKYDPYSLESWDIEGHGTVHVDDEFFDDHERVLTWYRLNEITLEPVSNDDKETKLEPVFWLSNKENFLELSESEMIPYLEHHYQGNYRYRPNEK
tara:strand:- start:147 stop:506 length:360 start_codon:yes stop_codon:yes gene_type:complete